MSWAAHNPEAYDEICEKGISAKLVATIIDYVDAFSDDQVQGVYLAIHILRDECPKAFSELALWASAEVTSAEADHFGGQADALEATGGER